MLNAVRVIASIIAIITERTYYYYYYLFILHLAVSYGKKYIH
jgi:hypothetical protein